jgi:hypothetical protein
MHRISKLRRAAPWLVWALPLLLVVLVWQGRVVESVNIGTTDDEHVVQQFYARETGRLHQQPYTYRWSRPNAHLLLPARTLPGVVELRGTPPPDGTQIVLDMGGQLQAALPTSSGEAVIRHYRLLWPAQSDGMGWARLHIRAEVPPERAEERPLGLLLAEVTLSSIEQAAPRLPPLPLLLLLGALPPLLALGLRLAGLSRLSSAALGLALGSAVILAWGWQPWWVQPFLSRILLGLLALMALLWWLRRAIPEDKHAPLPVPRLLLVLVVSSGLIPLFLLLKYGLDFSLSNEELFWRWVYQGNLPVLAMLAGLALPFVRGRLRAVLFAVVVLSVAGYGLDRFAGALAKDYSTDFTALFRGARSFMNGEPLYNLEHIRANHLGDTYKYPPFFVFLMGPLTGLFYVHAIVIWHLFNFALLLLAAGLLWRWSGQPLRSWSTAGLALLLLTFKPVVDALSGGQADIIMLVSLAAALLLLAQGRWFWWGAVLAFPAAVKLYTGYLLIHAVALRRWWGLAGFAAAFALLSALSVLAFGWDVHARFLFEVLPRIGGGTAWIENQTLNGFFNRFAVEQIALVPDAGGTIRVLTYAGALLFSALTFWMIRQMTPDAGFGLWIVTLLIILPIAWMHYQAILVLPFYQLLVRLERAGPAVRLGWRPLLLYALAWMLLCYGNQWTFFDRTMYEGPLWTLLLSYKLYGLLLLWAALASDPTARLQAAAAPQAEPLRRSAPAMQAR